MRRVRIVHHQQIELAVVVVIEPSGGHGPLVVVDSRLRRYIFERAVAAITIEDVAIHSRDKKIGMPVVVVIARRRAHRVALPGDAGAFRNIGEMEVAVVAVQPIPEFRGLFLERRNVGAVGEVDVRQTIAVVIEHGNSAGHGFDHEFFRRGAVFETKWSPNSPRHSKIERCR